MAKKKTETETETIGLSDSGTMRLTRFSIEDIDGLEHVINDFKYGLDTADHHAQEAAARATDSRDIANSLRDEMVKLINVVRDVDFRKTEFELGDIVLAKNSDMKRYKRGKIVGFGTGRRILVATMFNHLIATESDTFLIKRQPKGDK